MRRLRLVAVLVLYRRAPAASESLTTLAEALAAEEALGDGMRLLMHDNSPVAQEAPELPIETRYNSDPSNPGLAAAYNSGLAWAREVGAEWLLLLDQDTVLTREYLEELREVLPEMPAEVWAVVPKLVYAKGVHSPHFPPRLSHRKVSAEFRGMAMEEVSAFNSGAAMRVSAVEAVGGFPGRFPMEYLDHAMFHALQAAGGRVWVMGSALGHDLSTMHLDGAASLTRYRRMLLGEREFYRGLRWADRVWYRLRRVKQSLGHLVKVRDKRFAVWDLRAAAGALGREDDGPG